MVQVFYKYSYCFLADHLGHCFLPLTICMLILNGVSYSRYLVLTVCLNAAFTLHRCTYICISSTEYVSSILRYTYTILYMRVCMYRALGVQNLSEQCCICFFLSGHIFSRNSFVINHLYSLQVHLLLLCGNFVVNYIQCALCSFPLFCDLVLSIARLAVFISILWFKWTAWITMLL